MQAPLGGPEGIHSSNLSSPGTPPPPPRPETPGNSQTQSARPPTASVCVVGVGGEREERGTFSMGHTRQSPQGRPLCLVSSGGMPRVATRPLHPPHPQPTPPPCPPDPHRQHTLPIFLHQQCPSAPRTRGGSRFSELGPGANGRLQDEANVYGGQHSRNKRRKASRAWPSSTERPP